MAVPVAGRRDMAIDDSKAVAVAVFACMISRAISCQMRDAASRRSSNASLQWLPRPVIANVHRSLSCQSMDMRLTRHTARKPVASRAERPTRLACSGKPDSLCLRFRPIGVTVSHGGWCVGRWRCWDCRCQGWGRVIVTTSKRW